MSVTEFLRRLHLYLEDCFLVRPECIFMQSRVPWLFLFMHIYNPNEVYVDEINMFFEWF